LARALRRTGTRAFATGYPERPVTFICPWPAGGTADLTMRALCVAAAKQLGQTIVVENKTGASGMLGLKAMASAKPDGYTIGQIPISVTRFSQLGSVQIDPLKDLTYIARTSGQTFGIAVLAASPHKTLKDLVAHAKGNPGKVTYGSAGIGGATHVGMESSRWPPASTSTTFRSRAARMRCRRCSAAMSTCSPTPARGRRTCVRQAAPARDLGRDAHQRLQGRADPEGRRLQRRRRRAERHRRAEGPRPGDRAKLREAFKVAAASPEFKAACAKIDAPLMYLDGPDYEKYVAATYRRRPR
jgi:tripartite-type tricarboxylate transporter receptor subunit TctC